MNIINIRHSPVTKNREELLRGSLQKTYLFFFVSAQYLCLEVKQTKYQLNEKERKNRKNMNKVGEE